LWLVGGQTTRKFYTVRATDSYLGRIELRKETECQIRRSRIDRCGACWPSLGNTVVTEPRGIDEVRTERVSFGNRRKGFAGCRVDDLIVVFVRSASTGLITKDSAAEAILARKIVIGADDVVVLRTDLIRSKGTIVMERVTGVRYAANLFATECATDGEKRS